MIEGLVGVYDLDHSTTPEVVRISKESNILDYDIFMFLDDDMARCTSLSIFELTDLIRFAEQGCRGGRRRILGWDTLLVQVRKGFFLTRFAIRVDPAQPQITDISSFLGPFHHIQISLYYG